MHNIFTQLKEYKKWKQQKSELAKGNNEYFLNSFNNMQLWQKVIQECNKNEDLKVTFRLADGTSVELKTVKKDVYVHRPGFSGTE